MKPLCESLGRGTRSTEADLTPSTPTEYAMARRCVGTSRQFVELAADKAGGIDKDCLFAGRSHLHADLMGVATAIKPDGKPRPHSS